MVTRTNVAMLTTTITTIMTFAIAIAIVVSINTAIARHASRPTCCQVLPAHVESNARNAVAFDHGDLTIRAQVKHLHTIITAFNKEQEGGMEGWSHAQTSQCSRQPSQPS